MLCISAFEYINHSYNEEQNTHWHVGLYTSVIVTAWGWHLSAETCRCWCMS